MLGVVSLAQFLGMTLWFSATAVAPLLIDEFDISPGHAAWLTMAVQAGFVAGTLLSAVSNIADVFNPRVLMFIGSLVGACANAAVLVAPSGSAVIAMRFVTGASLALVYPPAMKIAAGWFRGGRGFALGLLIGALTLGKAFPHLLTTMFGAEWREPMLLASALAVIGGTLVLLIVRDGPHVAPTAPFDRTGDHARPVQSRRAVGHIGLPRAHVGAVCDVDLGRRVCDGEPCRIGHERRGPRGIAGRLRRDRQRRHWVCAGRLYCRSDRQGSGRDVGHARECRLRRVDAGGLRARAGLAVCADHGVGVLGGGRFGTILRAGQRARATRSCRNSADLADVRRVPVDDGDDRAAAARRGCDELAMGIALAGPRSVTRCLGDETPGGRLTA